MPQPPLLFVLRERAGLQPDDTAFTYTDYELDWAGVPGDRAVILAPQGLCVEHYRGEQFIRLDA